MKSLYCLIPAFLAFFASSAPAEVNAGAKIALPASHFKVMTAIYRGHGDPQFKADIESIKSGPEQRGQIPLYVTFGADRCFAGVFGESELGALDFVCRAEKSLWSLDHVLDGAGVAAEDLGLDGNRAAVLVLVPSMVKASCRACVTAVIRARARAQEVDPEARVIEVDLVY